MRLLRLNGCEPPALTDDLHDDIPPYAILSHTWGADQDEVTLEALRDGSGKRKPGYAKIEFCEQQARKDKLEYVWLDTCCIDKSNHAELSEALNSMFRWYQNADRCYVYLSDVSVRKREHEGSNERPWESALRASRWFTRGWTLQELLAPKSLEFFSKEGQLLGNKDSLNVLIPDVTGIPSSALHGAALSEFSVDERMRWAAKRNTKRVEDKVYCLLGIFEVFMTPIYGEGDNALVRLKDEIGKSYRYQLDGIGQSLTPLKASGLDNAVIEPREDIMSLLYFDQMDSRRSTIKSAYSNTCTWVLTHAAYTDWMDPEKLEIHNGFLWINGKPGAGKSTLVKFSHAHAERENVEGEVIISFFFNARGEDLERSTSGMYRTLLFQLLKKMPELQDTCNKIYASLKYHNRGSIWTVELLCKLLSGAIAKLGHRRLKCFIDALDECDEQQVQDMIVFFEDLGQTALQGGQEVYICFASRHYPTIDIRNGCQLILEDQIGHSEDMAEYIRSHLRAGKGKYIEDVRIQIQEKANGVFMWVILVVDILNKEFRGGRIFAVKKRLDEIPAKLGDLFKDILRRDYENMEDLLLCLQWILFAKRPLSREEFYFAMVAGLDPGNMTVWDPDSVTLDDMNRFVLNSSKGLAELTKSKAPTVQFIHESVRDFLVKDGGLSELWPSIGEHLCSASHEALKHCCWSYLTASSSSCACVDTIPKASSDEAKALRQRLNATYPFLEYASKHVLYHANEAASEIPQDDFLKGLDLKNLLNISRQLERYEVRRHTPNASLGYILAEQNFHRLIHTARHCGYALNERGERYHFPIFAAIANTHRAAIAAILRQDETMADKFIADVDSRRDVSVKKNLSPLLWAFENKHLILAEALLRSGETDLNFSRNEHRFKDRPLFIAAELGHERLVKLLLTLTSINLHATNIFGETALLCATKRGHVATAQALVEKGANIEAIDSVGNTALLLAARDGRETILQLLLDLGANVDAKNHYGSTPLFWATNQGTEGAVRLLVERGADMEAQDKIGKTALIRAAELGRRVVTQQLIERGANIEAKDFDGGTALLWAIIKGDEGTVQLLVERGANIEAKGFDGGTALSWAIMKGDEGTVQLLVERGANMEAKNISGCTSLMQAASLRQAAMVQLLIKQGANVEATDQYGRSSLDFALENEDAATVSILLASGARPLRSRARGSSTVPTATYI